MSDEEPQMLLDPSGKKESKWPLYAGIAAAAAGVFFLTRKKKDDDDDEKKKGKELPEAKANAVKFTSDFSDYEVGETWQSTQLDPYLEEAVEDDLLATPEWKDKGPIGWGMTDESLLHYMNHTRQKVLSGFYATHAVVTPKGNRFMSQMPTTPAVEDFFSKIDDLTRKFQEDY